MHSLAVTSDRSSQGPADVGRASRLMGDNRHLTQHRRCSGYLDEAQGVAAIAG